MNRYDTYTIMAMVEEIEAKRTFFLDRFFRNVVNFTTGHVEFDMKRGGKRVAPFVSPLVAGVPLVRSGYVTKTFKPAYLKPKSMVQPTDALVRMAGEGHMNAQMTPSQRMDALMSQELVEHDDMVTNRLEWMAAKAILDGGYLVDGEDYQATYVDFGHDPNLRVALVGAAVWSLNSSDPISDIENMALRIRTASRGAVCTDVVMGTTAAQYFRRHPMLKDRIDTTYRRAQSTTLDDGARNDTGAFYIGKLDGRFDIWSYEDYLTDDDGNDVPVMNPTDVIVSAPNAIEGGQYFGAILDADADFQAVRMYSKSRSSFDPTGEELLSQSAPLVAPKRMNTWGIISVA